MDRNYIPATALRQSPKLTRSATSEVRLNAAEKRLSALELRKAGLPYRQIGRELGISQTMAHNYVKSELARLFDKCEEEAIEIRALELERLDRLLMAIWTNATRGDLGSVDRVLKIMERRAKLLGLDAPTKVAPTNPEGDEEWDPTFARMELAEILQINVDMLPD